MKNIRWHILFWSCYFMYVCISDIILEPGYRFSLELIFFITQNLYLFYGLLFFLKKFSSNSIKETLKSILRLVTVLSIFFSIRYFFRYYFIPKYIDPIYGQVTLSQFTMGGILWITNYFIFALAYFYLTRSIQKEHQRRQAIEQQLLAEQSLHTKEQERLQAIEQQLQAEHDLHAKEQERLQLENIALRAQINPHFLYNTLGFLYAEALPHSDKLSEGIVRLSEIMQYSIKPHDASGMVLLEDEIEHVENVLEINKLRFGQAIYVYFTYEGQRSGVRMVPLVLLTLVENVLKHGQLNDPEYPATIHLKLDGTKLTFTTHNKKRSGPKERSTSIGLNNTRKRLQNVYGQNFSLTSKDEDEYFITTLMIDNIRQASAKAVN